MRFVIGFLIGLVIGVGAVLLTTPQSGHALQKGVRSRFEEIMAEGRKAADIRRAELEARVAELRGE